MKHAFRYKQGDTELECALAADLTAPWFIQFLIIAGGV